jgi:hypothetical protein
MRVCWRDSDVGSDSRRPGERDPRDLGRNPADDFARARGRAPRSHDQRRRRFFDRAISALQQARIAAGEVKKDPSRPLGDGTNFTPEIQAHLDKANGAVDEVLAKQARVHLLFGDQSPAGLAAAGVTSQLRNMLMALEHRPDSIRDPDEMSRYSRNFTSTLEQHERFNLAALVVLQQTWWDRFRERRRLRKRISKKP